MGRKTYHVHSRYLVAGDGWKHDVEIAETSYELAGELASRRARELDARYGADHFWTVDLKAPDGASYFQLFHGRLS